MKGLIGVLGGMGPAATVDLFNKFVTFTAAQRDQEHIPLIISSIPDIPDRTDALMHHGHSPLPAMRDYMHKLEDAGAECIVIPCNTAHFWFNELKSAVIQSYSVSLKPPWMKSKTAENHVSVYLLPTPPFTWDSTKKA